MSKMATVDYLRSHFDEDVSLDRIYNYMDKLYNTQKELVQEISVEHTRKILGGKVGIVFYDCTTLYFESFIHDKLCEPGYSKDGKSKENQIVLGLLVSANGYPLAYSVFCGSQYEGLTMIPVVEDFVRRFHLEDFVVVADSGLMTKKNLLLLQRGGYKYILGARIRNEAKEVKEWILSQEKKEDEYYEYEKVYEIPANDAKAPGKTITVKDRLIITYSEDRAKKDADNRRRGVERLRRAFSSGTIKKDSINRRGYNKFLDITKDVGITINEDKIKEDEKWDGWKGYITNTALEAKVTVSEYHGLWVVERAFRVTKGNLEMRPVFHFTVKRIEAHICICFISYKVYKEFERILKMMKFPLSVDKVLEIAKTIPTVSMRLPYNQGKLTKTLFLTEAHRSIKPIFDLREFFG
jgi:transposase